MSSGPSLVPSTASTEFGDQKAEAGGGVEGQSGRSQGCWSSHRSEVGTEVSRIPGMRGAGEGVTGERKDRDQLREIKRVTCSPVSGP